MFCEQRAGVGRQAPPFGAAGRKDPRYWGQWRVTPPPGRRTVNTEPLPGSLVTVTSPPIIRACATGQARAPSRRSAARIRLRLVMVGDPAAPAFERILDVDRPSRMRARLRSDTQHCCGSCWRNSAPPPPKPRGGPSALAGQEERAGQLGVRDHHPRSLCLRCSQLLRARRP
jgi:hypothetical protein